VPSGAEMREVDSFTSIMILSGSNEEFEVTPDEITAAQLSMRKD
jgi:hypothetical protein